VAVSTVFDELTDTRSPRWYPEPEDPEPPQPARTNSNAQTSREPNIDR